MIAIHPVGEEKKSARFLVSLVAKTFKKAGKEIKNGKDWNQREQVDSETSHTLGNVNKSVAILVHFQ